MLDAVVIGAGHAGLAASRRLADAGLDHVVLEGGEVGESWRSQRWDSFALNTPNALNRLPGAPDPADPEAFEPRDAWVARLARYAAEQRLPVRTRTTVTAVEQDGGGFVVRTSAGDPIRARNVIVASGTSTTPRIPAVADDLDARIARLTAGAYRRADRLAPGAVLVVGSAQSGGQIVEDLLDAGRQVLIATGTVGRVPRRHRGRDTLVWLSESGWLDQRPADLADPAMMRSAQPLISGVGPRGHTVSLQSLAAHGATLLGRLEGLSGTRARFGADLPVHIRFGDEISARMRAHIDDFIDRSGRAAEAFAPDPADEPARDPDSFAVPREIDLADRGVGTVIFATGFRCDLSWLKVPVVEGGAPIHDEGRSPVPGLWFLGWVWMRRRKSGIIWGAAEDSAHVVDQVVARLATAPGRE
jgi:putative flavoprotein involved in K+ transport